MTQPNYPMLYDWVVVTTGNFRGQIGQVTANRKAGHYGIQFGADGPFRFYAKQSLRFATKDEIKHQEGT